MKSFLQKLMFWKSRAPRVALVRLTGIIAAGSGPLKRGLNLDTIDPVLKKAFGMRRIKAVILVINSPGGSPVQSNPVAIGWLRLRMRFLQIMPLSLALSELFLLDLASHKHLKSWVLNGAYTLQVSQNQC